MNSAVEDVITGTSESPLLDERSIRTGNTVSQNELARIPTARDPWTVLQSTPGVLIDRVNVGGNESGQQSTYTGPGSFQNQAIWSVDGVVITDMRRSPRPRPTSTSAPSRRCRSPPAARN